MKSLVPLRTRCSCVRPISREDGEQRAAGSTWIRTSLCVMCLVGAQDVCARISISPEGPSSFDCRGGGILRDVRVCLVHYANIPYSLSILPFPDCHLSVNQIKPFLERQCCGHSHPQLQLREQNKNTSVRVFLVFC